MQTLDHIASEFHHNRQCRFLSNEKNLLIFFYCINFRRKKQIICELIMLKKKIFDKKIDRDLLQQNKQKNSKT